MLATDAPTAERRMIMELKRCANCSNGAWSCRESQLPDVCLICRFRSDGTPSEWKPKVATNADRIRAMSDEELEDFLLGEEWMCDAYDSCSVCPLRGEKGCISTLEWLKQPAEEETDERMPEK